MGGHLIRRHLHPVSVDRAADVLDCLFTKRNEPRLNIRSDMIMDLFGQRDPAWIRYALKPRCNIDAVAVDIVVLNDDISEMDADAQSDGIPQSRCTNTCAQLVLYVDRTLHSADDTRELQ